jgi:hypothetical protein
MDKGVLGERLGYLLADSMSMTKALVPGLDVAGAACSHRTPKLSSFDDISCGLWHSICCDRQRKSFCALIPVVLVHLSTKRARQYQADP